MKSTTIVLEANKAPSREKFNNAIHQMKLKEGYNIVGYFNTNKSYTVYVSTNDDISEKKFHNIVDKFIDLIV